MMSSIKKFIENVSYLESKPGKDLIMSAQDARSLRDEICKLLVDKVQSKNISQVVSTPVSIINGGSFK